MGFPEEMQISSLTPLRCEANRGIKLNGPEQHQESGFNMTSLPMGE